jgi:predicted SAM-dependent methyltransferase
MSDIFLNLGCFDKRFPKPYINVDIRKDVNPDIVDNAFELNKFDDDSVDLIYCSHMFEHLKPPQASMALSVWFRKLKINGIIRLAVPDFKAICRRYIYTENLNELDKLLYGSQKHEFDYHYAVYDFEKIKNLLESHGFTDIEKWDWWNTEHNRYIDDFSRAYLPSNQPDIALSHNRLLNNNGLLMSLNIQAKKEKQ